AREHAARICRRVPPSRDVVFGREGFGMKSMCEVIVSRRAFVTAATERVIRRVPRGARSTKGRPDDTLLYAEGSALIVETPTRRTDLPMTGSWTVDLTISTAVLARACSALKAGEALSLAFAPGLLILDGGAFALPAVS